MARNYELAEQLERLGDDVLVGVEEVAALTGFAQVTIQQRSIKGFPQPISGPRKLRWKLGAIRAWGRAAA
jgi:predicted DNA-binding transcriptional regulator AlpA